MRCATGSASAIGGAGCHWIHQCRLHLCATGSASAISTKEEHQPSKPHTDTCKDDVSLIIFKLYRNVFSESVTRQMPLALPVPSLLVCHWLHQCRLSSYDTGPTSAALGATSSASAVQGATGSASAVTNPQQHRPSQYHTDKDTSSAATLS